VAANRAGTGLVKEAFNQGPDFPNIRKVTIPDMAHPILSRFPNVEDLVCLQDPQGRTRIGGFMKSLRGPYVRERRKEIEPILKSFRIIGKYPDPEFAEGMYTLIPLVWTLGLIQAFA